MKTRVLILISVLSLSARAQDVRWDQIGWGDARAKQVHISPARKIAPVAAGIAAVGAVTALSWPGKGVLPQPIVTPQCNRIFNATTTPARCLSATGQASIFSDDTDPFSVVWLDGSTELNRFDLVSGQHVVAIAYDQCITDLIIIVPTTIEAVDLEIVEMIPASSADASDGAVTVLVTSPIFPPFVFTWEGVSANPSEEPTWAQSGLSPGTYSLQVTDAHGCEGTISFTVETEPACEIETQVTTVPALCLSPSGAAQILAPNGELIEVHWPDGTIADSRSDLAPGTYDVEIVFGDCSVTVVIEIPSTQILVSIDLLDVQFPTDPLAQNGAFQVLAGPMGTPPFQFELNGFVFPPDNSPFFLAENLGEGFYEIVVTDANGCTGSLTIPLFGPLNFNPENLRKLNRSSARRFQWVFTPVWWFNPPGGLSRR